MASPPPTPLRSSLPSLPSQSTPSLSLLRKGTAILRVLRQSQAWYYKSVIPAHGRKRQDDLHPGLSSDLQNSLTYKDTLSFFFIRRIFFSLKFCGMFSFFPIFIRYFLHLHFKCYSESPPRALLHNPPTPASSGLPLYWVICSQETKGNKSKFFFHSEHYCDIKTKESHTTTTKQTNKQNPNYSPISLKIQQFNIGVQKSSVKYLQTEYMMN